MPLPADWGGGRPPDHTFNVVATAPPAFSANLIDSLSSGVTFVSATGGVSPVGNVLTIPLGTLSPNTSATVTIVVRLATTGPVSNLATAISTSPDIVPANNSATVDYLIPHVFTVRNTNNQGQGSLFQAILYADADKAFEGVDSIVFVIGAGTQTIRPIAQLPLITHPVNLDASSPSTYPTRTFIELDGTNAGTGTHGLVVAAPFSTIRRITINRFGGTGIVLTKPENLTSAATGETSGHDLILSSFIGTDVTGTIPMGNKLDGVDVEGTVGNVIGLPGQGNVIAANQVGVYLYDGASGNVIQANVLGFPASNSPFGNTSGGIIITGSNGNVVGGPSPGQGNVIGGSPNYSGLVISGGSTQNIVASNAIFDNGQAGVFILNSPENVIGVAGDPMRSWATASAESTSKGPQPRTTSCSTTRSC